VKGELKVQQRICIEMMNKKHRMAYERGMSDDAMKLLPYVKKIMNIKEIRQGVVRE